MSIGAISAAAARRAERRIIDHLREAGATSPASACPLPDLPRRIQRRRLDRLVATGSVVSSGQGLSYLDESAYHSYRRRRYARVATLVTVVATLATAALAWIAWRGFPG